MKKKERKQRKQVEVGEEMSQTQEASLFGKETTGEGWRRRHVEQPTEDASLTRKCPKNQQKCHMSRY